MKQIIQNYSLGLDANQVISLYRDATKKKFDFLKISVDERNDNKRFSHNFTGFYKINDESDDENEI
jgi:cytochrome oxidase Cu insertion factor (SCO1/SenC/PrrC family)